jgi:hypothetical protein
VRDNSPPQEAFNISVQDKLSKSAVGHSVVAADYYLTQSLNDLFPSELAPATTITLGCGGTFSRSN